MRIVTSCVLGLLAGLITLASTGLAHAQSCDDLWYERNAIYKRAGYCFKTPRAISTFGNAGCMYDSEYALPLSQRQRNRIAWIVRMERESGCP
jgi:YARHG domain